MTIGIRAKRLATVLLVGQAAIMGWSSIASAEWMEDASPCDVGPGALMPQPVRWFEVGADVDVPIGSFSDSEPTAEEPPPSDFTASAKWGDGEVTPAVVTRGSVSNCMHVSTSTHSYRTPGSYPFSYTVHDARTGLDHTLAATEFHIWSIVPQLVGDPTTRTISATVGLPWSGVVAEFDYEGPGNPSSSYSAEVEWGDGGVATAAAITAQSGVFTVSGSFTYSRPIHGTVMVSLSHLQHPLGTWSVSNVTVTAPSVPHSTRIRLRGEPVVAILPGAVDLLFATNLRLPQTRSGQTEAAVAIHGRHGRVRPLLARSPTTCYLAPLGLAAHRLRSGSQYPFTLSVEHGQQPSDRGRATAHDFASLARARAFAARQLGCR